MKTILTVISFLLVSCGGGGGGGSAIPPLVGYVVDAPVEGLSYVCGALAGKTGADGSFLHDSGAACTFKIGNITIGAFNSAPIDGVVTPHDLAGVSRGDSLNSSAVAIAQFLQSLNTGSSNTKITISDSVFETLSTVPAQKIVDGTSTLSQATLSNLVSTATGNLRQLIPATTAGAVMNTYIQTTYPGLDVSKGTAASTTSGSSTAAAPTLTSPPPSSLTAVLNSTGLTATTDIDSVGYYVALPSTATAPNKWQIVAGTDAANNPVSLSGFFNISAGTAATKTISELSFSTDYKVYLVATSAYQTSKMSNIAISTVTTGSARSPVISGNFPTTLTPSNNATSFSVTSDVSGTGYWIIVPSSATAPSASQVIAGIDGSYSSAFLKANVAFSGGISKDFSIAGLAYGTNYKLYFVAVNAFDNSKITTVMSADISAEYPAGVIGVQGNINSDATWTSGNKYFLTGDVGVARGKTLTIESGVTIYHDSGSLLVAGTLLANGTRSAKIYFTTLPSNLVGDAAKKSGGIKFSDSTGSSISYMTVENINGVAIQLDGDSVVPVTNSIFRNNYTVFSDTYGYQYMDISYSSFTDNHNVFSGIRTTNADILNNHFENNINVFEYGYFGAAVNVNGNNFINCALVFKANEGQTSINLRGNWWNTTDTNSINSLIYDSNDLVTLRTVIYLPISTSINTAGPN
jgi:trimeric autotransporter adhesin